MCNNYPWTTSMLSKSFLHVGLLLELVDSNCDVHHLPISTDIYDQLNDSSTAPRRIVVVAAVAAFTCDIDIPDIPDQLRRESYTATALPRAQYFRRVL